MKRFFLLLVVSVTCVITALAKTPKEVVEDFGTTLTKWCTTDDAHNREELEKMTQGYMSCRSSDKVSKDAISKDPYLPQTVGSLTMGSYFDIFQEAISKGQKIQFDNIKYEQSFVEPSVDKSYTYIVSADIKMQGYLNYNIRNLFYVRGNNITKIIDYTGEQTLGKGIEYYSEGNYKDAIIVFHNLADNGDAEALCYLGVCYLEGFGVEKDEQRAFLYFCSAAQKGYYGGQFYCGYCYSKGLGIEKDVRQKLFWYNKAAEQGCAEAQHNLAVHYTFIEFDKARSIDWDLKSAKNGLAIAQAELGKKYEYWYHDYNNAYTWYSQAAEQGEPSAQCNLGICYFWGNGVSKDAKTAEKWFRQSANNNCDNGQYWYAFCIAGLYDDEDHYKCAFEHYLKAAKQGHGLAQYRVGRCYKQGRGVSKNLNEALYWFKKCYENKGEYMSEMYRNWALKEL